TLTAAADKLRALADEATPGPWWTERPAARWGEDPDHEVAASAGTLAVFHERGSGLNAAYTAAMHPGVGAAIAVWLERKARIVGEVQEYLGDQFQDGALDHDAHDALAVARQILGGDQ
ncbi:MULTISPECIES: hypothetical protein, partial [unclassified Streptomyces]|uniref:hypothetical protein n=1 Tax=unclassified Streptomyces TaxID=2593676 RepID=UPI00081E0884